MDRGIVRRIWGETEGTAELAAQVESNKATIANLRQTMNELISLLVRKGVLAETEAAALLQLIYR